MEEQISYICAWIASRISHREQLISAYDLPFMNTRKFDVTYNRAVHLKKRSLRAGFRKITCNGTRITNSFKEHLIKQLTNFFTNLMFLLLHLNKTVDLVFQLSSESENKVIKARKMLEEILADNKGLYQINAYPLIS